MSERKTDLQRRAEAWHRKHFDASPMRVLVKAMEELSELFAAELGAQECDTEVCTRNVRAARNAVALECADVLIPLFVYASKRGFRLLDAVEEKLGVIEGRHVERIRRDEPEWTGAGRGEG